MRFATPASPSTPRSSVPAGAPALRTRPAPVQLDLVEHPDRYEIVADLPGVPAEGAEVEFCDGALRIAATRGLEPAPEDGRVLRRERGAQRYERTIAFRDDVEVDAVEASLREGVLRVRIPKAAQARPRQIPIAVH